MQTNGTLREAYAAYKSSTWQPKLSDFIQNVVNHTLDERLGVVMSGGPSFVFLYDKTDEPKQELWNCLASLIKANTKGALYANKVKLGDLAELPGNSDLFQRLLVHYGNYFALRSAIVSAVPELDQLIANEPSGGKSGPEAGLRLIEWYGVNDDYIQRHPELDPQRLDYSQAVETGGYGGYTKKTWRLGGIFIKGFRSTGEFDYGSFDPKTAGQLEYDQMCDLNECSHTAHVLGWGLFRDVFQEGDVTRVVERVVLVETVVPGEPLRKVGKKASGSYYSLVLEGRAVPDADPKSLLRTCVAMSVAIADCASVGVAHRDLHPANVLLSSSARGGFWAGLVDFGIAIQNDAEVTSPTHARGAQETFEAPEMIRGSKYYKSRNLPSVDVWSLGALCFFVLTGRPPASSDASLEKSKEEFGEQALEDEDIAALGPVGNEVQGVLLDCLKYVPSERITAIQAALRFQACLDAIEGGTPSNALNPYIKLARDAGMGTVPATPAEIRAQLKGLKDQVSELQGQATAAAERANNLERANEGLKHTNADLEAANASLQTTNNQLSSLIAKAKETLVKLFGPLEGDATDTIPPMGDSDPDDITSARD